MTKVIPMGRRVLVKQDAKIEKIKNGLIYIPESEQHQPPMGYVVSTGPKCEQVKEGDYVQWPLEINTTVMLHDEEEHLVIDEAAIIAVMMDV